MIVLDEIIQAIGLIPPGRGLTDKECLSAIIEVIETRLGQTGVE